MKELPIEININGVTYYSSHELASRELDWYNLGVRIGKEEGYKEGKANTIIVSVNRIDELKTEWYELGKADGINEGIELAKEIGSDVVKDELTWADAQYGPDYMKGYEAGQMKGHGDGYAEGFTKGYEGHKEGYDEGYENGYNDGYEQKKHDGISKINYNTEPIAQTAESEAYDNGFIKGKEEGWNEGYAEGYEDCREVTKMLNKLKQMPEHFAESKNGKTKPKDILERIFGKKE